MKDDWTPTEGEYATWNGEQVTVKAVGKWCMNGAPNVAILRASGVLLLVHRATLTPPRPSAEDVVEKAYREWYADGGELSFGTAIVAALKSARYLP